MLQDHVITSILPLIAPELIGKGPAVPPTHTLDWNNPAHQSFADGVDTTNQDHVWTFQESTGNVIDKSGSGNDLVPEAGILQGQRSNLWVSDDWTTRRACESVGEGGGEGFSLISTSVLDLGNGGSDLAIEISFRVGGVNSTRTLCEKRNNGFGPGYEIRISAAGNIFVSIEDDTTGSHTTSVSGVYNDGALHRIRAVFDFTNSLLTIEGDLNARVTTAITLVGDFTSTEPFEVLGAGQRGAPENCQITQIEAWTGADAVARDAAPLNFNWGSDRTGKLTTATHASLASFTVAKHPTLGELVQHWSGNGTHGQDQIPLRLLPSGVGLGIAQWNASTNIALHSEDFTDVAWVKSNCSVTAKDADAPDGTRRMTLLTQTAAGGYVEQAITVTVAAHTESVWIMAPVSQTVTVQLRDGSGLIATTLHTGTGKRERVSVTGTMTDVNGVIRIYPGSTGDSDKTCHAWGVQLVAGSKPGVYARTFGVAAVVAGFVCQFTNALNPERGEIRTTFAVDDLVGSDQTIFDGQGNDRRLHVINAVFNRSFNVRNNVGATVATIVLPAISANERHTTACAWDKDAGIDGSASVAIVEGTEEITGGAAFTAGVNDDFYIGSQSGVAGLAALEGAISKIVIYDRVLST